MTSSYEQTVVLLRQLQSILADKSINKKVQNLIKNLTQTQQLFKKLLNVIEQLNQQQQQQNIDKLESISKELIHLKQLLDENLNKITVNSKITSSFNECLLTIREQYRIIRNHVQTLEQINEKINRKILKNKHKNEIGQLIVRAINEKISNSICLQNQQQEITKLDKQKQSKILNEFYDHFLNYIPLIRQSSTNIFEYDQEYIQQLHTLQNSLFNHKSVNIKEYFLKIKDKLIDHNVNYSMDILLEDFVRNPLVHINVSNSSQFYSIQLSQLFQQLTASSHLESLTVLIFHLDRNSFQNFILSIFQNPRTIDVIFKIIYNKGIQLYSNSTTNFKEKFFDLFQLILSNKIELLDRLRDSIIDQTNQQQTFRLLSDLYGQRIQCLHSMDLNHVKYLFNFLFFKSLTYKQIDDVPTPSLFSHLLFYLHMYELNNSNSIQEQHEQHLIDLKNQFIQLYNQQNHKHFNDLVDTLRLLMNIQTFEFRLKTTQTILSQFNNKSNCQLETLKIFFAESQYVNELCLRLIQTSNSHLFEQICHRDLTHDDDQLLLCLLCKIFKSSSDSDSDQQDFNNECLQLSQSVDRFLRFYDHQQPISQQLKQISIEHLFNGLNQSSQSTFYETNQCVIMIIDNMINYHFQHVIHIIKIENSNQQVIIDLFNRILIRKTDLTLHDWTQNTSQLGDQLDFLYNSYQQLKDHQIATSAFIDDFIQDPNKNQQNLLMKIPTDQDKSFIIAETVRKIVEMNIKQQVFVITSYDYLAKTNFDKYRNYYKDFNIEPYYCSNQSSIKDLSNAHVIYADVQSYFNVLRKDTFHLLNNSQRQQQIDLPNVENAILILDEVDSFILDSDQIFQVAFPFHLHNFNPTMSFDNKDDLTKLFQGLLSNEEKLQFATLIDRWFDKLINEKQNSFLNQLIQQSKAYFVHFYLHPLLFFSKFKQIIGFSTTMTSNTLDRFKSLFDTKNCFFYEIPSAQALTNVANQRGLIKKTTVDYLDAIEQDIQQRYTKQPILIFADAANKYEQDKTDYELIYDRLIQAKQTFLKDVTIVRISKEQEIYTNINQIGRLGSITLATTIIARDVHIPIQRNIEKGLHLLLTYYPQREHIYQQIIQRIPAQGSFSQITRSKKHFIDPSTISIEPRKKIFHDINEYFYTNIHLNCNQTNLVEKWNFFSCLMQQMTDTEINQNDLILFIDKHIFKKEELQPKTSEKKFRFEKINPFICFQKHVVD